MLSTKLSVVLAAVLVVSAGCTQKKRPNGGAPKTTAQSQNPNRPTTSTPPSPQTSADFEERQKAIETLQATLREMNCEVEADNLACLAPSNYRQARDLEKTLKSYSQVINLQLQSNLLTPENRQTLQIHAKPLTEYIDKVTTQRKKFFEKDSYELYMAKEKLCMELDLKDLKLKRVTTKSKDGITQHYRLPMSKNLLTYKTPTQVIKAINEYQEVVRWFLDIYADNESPLHRESRQDLIEELQLTEDLAERVYRIGETRP